MSDQNPAAYTFLPWVRRGLSALIAGSSASNFASLPVTLALNGASVGAPPVRLPGPGDVTGLDAMAVIRTDPRDGANSFEPNYMASVDLATPDLPWLFTPSAPVNGRLQPWICLIVIPETAGASFQSQSGGPDILHIDAPLDPSQQLPDLTQIDVWAHAQVIGENLSAADLNSALLSNSSASLSRLICPRHLAPGQVYNACIVPTFHAGLNAGLGIAVDPQDVSHAWTATVTAPFAIPVYYRFRFSTGLGGDFASLARKILPANLPATVGGRPMDASQPGFGAANVPGATLLLEGALRVQGSQPAPWPAGTQAPYQTSLTAALVPAAAPDPVVTPPIYGASQSGAALPAAGAQPVWLGDLNLDPRNRVAASAGGMVVAQNQDALLASAWDQAGDIRKANQLLRQSQLARQVTVSFATRHLNTIAGDGQYLQVTAPVHGRVLAATGAARATLRGQIAASLLPLPAVSAQMRKLARRRGPIGRRFLSTGTPQIVERLNLVSTDAKSVTAAGPAKPPAGMVTLDAVAPAAPGTTNPIQLSLMTAKVQGAFQGTAVAAPQPAAPKVAALDTAVLKTTPATQAVDTTKVATALIDWTVDPNVPAVLNTVSPNLPAPLKFPTDATALAKMQTDFQTAASPTNAYLTATVAALPVPPPLGGTPGLDGVRSQLASRLNPEVTLAARVAARVAPGPGPDPLQPLISGPQFPQPMYSALARLSPEWMLPGISSAPADSAALLETNPRFVEAFLIGLNEEMARAFLWREFPADPRATFFQNFWSAAAPDIPPIASFSAAGSLGSHTSDAATGGTIVLLIRAELFSRYPNAVVSAAPAQWNSDKVTQSLGGQRQFPIFQGSMAPDFTFFGFNITNPVGSPDFSAGQPGWFFLIEEHSTEPRFGLESGTPGGPSWNDLRWEDFAASLSFLSPLTAPPTPTRDSVAWAADAAVMAFVLLRRPVRIAFHARALVPQGGPTS